MTISIVPSLENSCNVPQVNDLTYCTLQWRRNQLLVKPSGTIKQPCMPLLNTHESLKECLKNSSVKLVRIDPKLGEEKIIFWADACNSASKPIYLRIGAAGKHEKINSSLLLWLKRLTEWAIASVTVVVLSPLMLLLALLIKSDAQAPLFERSWHVGERGKLFKSIKYRTLSIDKDKQSKIPQFARVMSKYGLDNSPQLFNVIRGEIGLFGSRCWTLEDAVRLTPQAQKQLNNLPGIADSWEVEPESEASILHLDSQTL